jgi:hypothetical protein
LILFNDPGRAPKFEGDVLGSDFPSNKSTTCKAILNWSLKLQIEKFVMTSLSSDLFGTERVMLKEQFTGVRTVAKFQITERYRSCNYGELSFKCAAAGQRRTAIYFSIYLLLVLNGSSHLG